MNRSLHFKMVLIFVLFILSVISIMGTIMLGGVFFVFTSEFSTQMSKSFGGTLGRELAGATGEGVEQMMDILATRTGLLGIDNYRNYYILDGDGRILAGSDTLSGEAEGILGQSPQVGDTLEKTPNILSAMNGRIGDIHQFGVDYIDYAYPIGSVNKFIIYIRDTQEEMRSFTWMIFTIIIQSLLVGLLIALILSFFLAKAITSPIQSLIKGAQRLATGELKEQLDVHSRDEIGMLTQTFNDMAGRLNNTLDEVSGEREKLSTIFLYLEDGVLAYGADGTLMHVNPLAERLLGAAGKWITLSGLVEMLEIDNCGEIACGSNKIYRDVACGDSILDINFGTYKYVQDNEQQDGIIAVLHDITERYELEKSRREFVANVSHELRTPLTSIKGATETVLETPDMEEDMRRHFLSIVINESDRMTRIVKDLLVLSRLDSNKMQWRYQSVDTENMLKQIYGAMQLEAAERSHTFTLDIPAPLPFIEADKERIEQVLVNIISNALKYTPVGGKISLEAYSEGTETVVLRVRDNGIGIPEQDIPRLFERFYRVEKARSSETGGTGLGLAIAKEIVSAHNGRISVESRQGEGTTVTVVLPLERVQTQ